MGSNWDNWKREEYHLNFGRRARWRKKRVKYTCEKCGAKRGETRLNRAGLPYRVMVAAAHLDHDPWNPRARLIILCQSCHLKLDGSMHGKKMRSTKYRMKRDAQIKAGQLELPFRFKTPPKRRKRKP